MATIAASPSVSNEIFNLIRGQEANFPFPVTKRTITVGTFDAAKGTFSYSVPTVKEELDGTPKPKVLIGGVITAINVIEIVLRFKIKNRTGEVRLSVPGLPVVRTSTANSLDINIGAAAIVPFTLTQGARKFTSQNPLEIQRFTAGAGVFEVPAFPIAIIYAPVPDQALRNASQWKVSKSTGNTTTLSIGKSTSTGRPVQPEFFNVNLIAGEMRALSQTLDLLNGKKGFSGNPDVELISKGLNLIAGALGSSSASETDGISTTSEHSVALSIAKEQTISTNAASGGPGRGDLIYYLKSVKLAWFTSEVGRVRVTVFGHDGLGVTSVGFLRNGGQTDLDPDTVAQFLQLDPFVAGGPAAVLPADRFVYLDTIDLNGGEISQTETYTITAQDTKKTTTTHTRVEKNTQGFFHFLGIGVTSDESTEAEATSSSAVQTSDSHAISNTISLSARPDERYSMEVYCDVIFGTFAYRPALSGPTPVLEGVVRGSDGKPAAGRIVTLINNGRRFTTHAGADGHYSFHAKTIRPGPSEVHAGAGRQRLTLTGSSAKRDLVG